MAVGWGGDRLCQTSPIPRPPDGDNKSGGIFAQAHVLPIVCVNLIKAAPVHCPGRNPQHELQVSSRPSTCGTR